MGVGNGSWPKLLHLVQFPLLDAELGIVHITADPAREASEGKCSCGTFRVCRDRVGLVFPALGAVSELTECSGPVIRLGSRLSSESRSSGTCNRVMPGQPELRRMFWDIDLVSIPELLSQFERIRTVLAALEMVYSAPGAFTRTRVACPRFGCGGLRRIGHRG